jgi:hypothetical protein
MADLTPTAGKDGVYQIETTDLVQGGAGGIANDPHQNLINRSELLFDALDGTISNANIAVLGDITIMGDTGATTEEAFKVDTTTDGTRLTYISQRLKIWSDTTVEGGQLTFTDENNVEAWHIDVGSTTNLRIVDGSANTFTEMNGTEIVFNESGIDRNFRIEGDTDANLFFLDAGRDNIGIGTNLPATNRKLDLTTDFQFGVSSSTSDTTAGSAAISATQTGTGAVQTYGIQASASADSSRAVEGIANNTGAVTNYGGYFEAKGQTGRGMYSLHSGSGLGYGGYFVSTSTTAAATALFAEETAASGGVYAIHGKISSTTGGARAVYGEVTGTTGATYGGYFQNPSTTDTATAVRGAATGATGINYGGNFTCVSTNTSAAACRGSGDGTNSYDFIAANSRVSGFSGRHYKVAKRNIDILQKIRDYNNWHIDQWSYKYNESFDDMIMPYADEFNEAFDYNPENDDMLNTSNLSGIAFGGVVQLVNEIDKLKEEIRLLKESK